MHLERDVHGGLLPGRAYRGGEASGDSSHSRRESLPKEEDCTEADVHVQLDFHASTPRIYHSRSTPPNTINNAMSRSRQDRVDDALSQLVDRALPVREPNGKSTSDTDAAAAADDERFQRVLELVHNLVGDSTDQQANVQDVNHVADLIRQQLLGTGDTEHALKFGNLYARLLALPVLTQKWGILYLLHLLADNAANNIGNGDAGGRLEQHVVAERRSTSRIHDGPYTSSRTETTNTRMRVGVEEITAQRDSRVFDDAFARPGLPDLSSRQQQRRDRQPQPSDRPPATARHRPQPQLNGHATDNDSGSQSDRTRSRKTFVTESALLRDLPFTLQGVSTTNLSFSSPTVLRLPAAVPLPVLSILNTLAEPALLYKGISAYLDSSEGGLIAQSLRAAIGSECRSYLGLIASLESQIRKALVQIDDTEGQSGKRKGLGTTGVTLKRCVLWTREATLSLRLMSLIVEQSRTRKGGPLITFIHSLATTHGDPFVAAFAERLLTHVTKPFYDMLRLWIYEGELSDPYLEFFVSEQPTEGEDEGIGRYAIPGIITTGRGAATNVWETKYHFDTTAIPSIISPSFAQKVFLIGKSLNFIRHACNDAAWVEQYSKSSSATSNTIYYTTSTTTELTDTITTAYRTTQAHLTFLLSTKFQLQSHLQALKHYLLLTRGDFIALLTTSLSPYLSLPANSQYRHTLTAQLEAAVRGSNAQFDPPEVLRRLDARMLELSHGDIGWEVFTLEYRVEAPLDVIVTPHSNRQYLKVFNFLWRIKRVEFALSSTWQRATTGARGVLGKVDDVLGGDWKAARGVVAEMSHLLAQLQNYILFEVIETSWARLQQAMAAPDATLDDLIEAHAEYLRSITRKGLLGSSSSASAAGMSGSGSHGQGHSTDFTPQLHEVLKLMLAYKEAVDALYALSVAEFNRRQAREARIEQRSARGAWGVTERDEDVDSTDSPLGAASARKGRSRGRVNDTDSGRATPVPALLKSLAKEGDGQDEATATLTALRRRLTELAGSFRTRVSVLLGDLATQPDTELRFLGVVMNFNDAYKVVRRSHGGHHGGSKSRMKDRDRENRERERDRERKASAAPAAAEATAA